MPQTYREVILTHYLSRQEAADYLGVTTRTIDRYLADEKLAFVRVGPRLIRIPLASIEAFLTKAGA